MSVWPRIHVQVTLYRKLLMAISTNQKPTLYRSLYENKGPGYYMIVQWLELDPYFEVVGVLSDLMLPLNYSRSPQAGSIHTGSGPRALGSKGCSLSTFWTSEPVKYRHVVLYDVTTYASAFWSSWLFYNLAVQHHCRGISKLSAVAAEGTNFQSEKWDPSENWMGLLQTTSH